MAGPEAVEHRGNPVRIAESTPITSLTPGISRAFESKSGTLGLLGHIWRETNVWVKNAIRINVVNFRSEFPPVSVIAIYGAPYGDKFILVLIHVQPVRDTLLFKVRNALDSQSFAFCPG